MRVEQLSARSGAVGGHHPLLPEQGPARPAPPPGPGGLVRRRPPRPARTHPHPPASAASPWPPSPGWCRGDLDAADEALLGELSGPARQRPSARARGPTASRTGRRSGPSGTDGGPLTIDELADGHRRSAGPAQGDRGRRAADPPAHRRPGALHRRGRGRGPGRPAAPRVGHPAVGPARPGPSPSRGHRGGGPRGGGAVLDARPAPPPPEGRMPDRRRRRTGRPETGDVDRLVQAYAELLPAVNTLVATTSPGPWSTPPSTTSNRSAPTPSGRPSGIRSAPTRRTGPPSRIDTAVPRR